MSTTPPADAPQPAPLLPQDPPKVGEFWLDARAADSAAGVAYLAHRSTQRVILVMLCAGAASDGGARDRLAGQVNLLPARMVLARGGQGQDSGRLGHLFQEVADGPAPVDQTPPAPWVALVDDGTSYALQEARRILGEVELAHTSQLGRVAGPSFQVHWAKDRAPGTSRSWPLPWPGRHDQAGWSTTVVAWLLTLVIAGLGLLIAVLLFQNVPPTPPPPPVPTSPPPPPTSNSSSSPTSSPSSSQQSPSSGGSGSSSPSPQPSDGQSSRPESSSSPSKGSASPTPTSSGEPHDGRPSASGSPDEHPNGRL
ncbi:MAG: hypothetical protein R5N76_04965 [Cutibacterium granulosum]|nr:hypothetical protein [Cutibacterium granulosum]